MSKSNPEPITGHVPLAVDILPETAKDRAAVETFIRDHYARAYGAEVRHFLPHLMTLRRSDNRLIAALGYRDASTSDSLYLEHYLDLPVEVQLSLRSGQYCTRKSMVEVGNLVTAEAGGARWLATALTAYLKNAGYDWAVFTAVRQLRNAFARLGIELIPLAAADATRLPEMERMAWGRYYETQPIVVAASVHQSHDALLHQMQRTADRYHLRPLWDEASLAGMAA